VEFNIADFAYWGDLFIKSEEHIFNFFEIEHHLLKYLLAYHHYEGLLLLSFESTVEVVLNNRKELGCLDVLNGSVILRLFLRQVINMMHENFPWLLILSYHEVCYFSHYLLSFGSFSVLQILVYPLNYRLLVFLTHRVSQLSRFFASFGLKESLPPFQLLLCFLLFY
jgi:hypothetical protein